MYILYFLKQSLYLNQGPGGPALASQVGPRLNTQLPRRRESRSLGRSSELFAVGRLRLRPVRPGAPGSQRALPRTPSTCGCGTRLSRDRRPRPAGPSRSRRLRTLGSPGLRAGGAGSTGAAPAPGSILTGPWDPFLPSGRVTKGAESPVPVKTRSPALAPAVSSVPPAAVPVRPAQARLPLQRSGWAGPPGGGAAAAGERGRLGPGPVPAPAQVTSLL